MDISNVGKLLATCKVYGYNNTTAAWDLLPYKGILESSARQASGRFSMYSSRSLLLPELLGSGYEIVRVGSQLTNYLVYVEQLNELHNKTYLYDYTVFSTSDSARLITRNDGLSASGLKGISAETIGTITYPCLLQRLSGLAFTDTPEAATTRFEAAIPKYAGVTTDMELLFNNVRYLVNEAYTEYRTQKLTLIQR